MRRLNVGGEENDDHTDDLGWSSKAVASQRRADGGELNRVGKLGGRGGDGLVNIFLFYLYVGI
jgi:hypothetical protein